MSNEKVDFKKFYEKYKDQNRALRIGIQNIN